MSTSADKLKHEGNALYAERKFAEALERYQEGLNCCSPDFSVILKLNQAACLLALERFCEAAEICEDLIKNGKLGERREKTIYRLISALIGVAEDGEDATRTLSRARQLLDDFTRERTLKISLQNRIFSLARSSSIRLRPPEAKFDVTYIAPKDDEPPVMLLIVLHGFGDGKAALGKMAEKMQLPGVACLVLQGPHRLPSELLPAGGEEIGYYWFDNIDWARGGEPLTRRDESLERASLESLCKLSGYINETLIGTVGWTSSEIAFLGVGQGGTLALEIGRRMEKEFAGFFVLNPDELPLGCPEEKRRVPQRVVLVSGREDGAPSFSSVRSIESELASEGDMAQLHEQPGKAMDVLKDRNGKGEIFMRFIASRLAAVRMRSLGAEEVN